VNKSLIDLSVRKISQSLIRVSRFNHFVPVRLKFSNWHQASKRLSSTIKMVTGSEATASAERPVIGVVGKGGREPQR